MVGYAYGVRLMLITAFAACVARHTSLWAIMSSVYRLARYVLYTGEMQTNESHHKLLRGDFFGEAALLPESEQRVNAILTCHQLFTWPSTYTDVLAFHVHALGPSASTSHTAASPTLCTHTQPMHHTTLYPHATHMLPKCHRPTSGAPRHHQRHRGRHSGLCDLRY